MKNETQNQTQFMNDVTAAVTTFHQNDRRSYLHEISRRVATALKAKAELGWYPGSNIPLGYTVKRETDESGRVKKHGRATICVSPNKNLVQWVQREFELAAQGCTLKQIRNRIILEGFVRPENSNKYRADVIKKRLTSSFYAGRFVWEGIEYEGKHEVIIPSDIYEAAQQNLATTAKQKPEVNA